MSSTCNSKKFCYCAKICFSGEGGCSKVNSIYRINHYLADSLICFNITYLLDRDLFGGQQGPTVIVLMRVPVVQKETSADN